MLSSIQRATRASRLLSTVHNSMQLLIQQPRRHFRAASVALGPILASEIRVGDLVEINSKLCVVKSCYHVKPGKGGAFAQVEMVDVAAGTKHNTRLRSDEKVEYVDAGTGEPYSILFREGDKLHLMHASTFEQEEISVDLIPSEQLKFVGEGVELKVYRHKEKPFLVKLPKHLTSKVVEVEIVAKGNSPTGKFKAAKLESGATINVPQFVNPGDMVTFTVEDGAYMGRE